MSDERSDALFTRLESLRGRVDEATLEAIEKRLDEADRSLAYHTQQEAEAHAPDIQIANHEMVARRRREINAIRSEVEAVSRQGPEPNETPVPGLGKQEHRT
jgi:hypothetical protein